jgi:hypothetical protein
LSTAVIEPFRCLPATCLRLWLLIGRAISAIELALVAPNNPVACIATANVGQVLRTGHGAWGTRPKTGFRIRRNTMV